MIGGPEVVDQYIASLGIRGFHLEDDEHALHRDASAQYRNWLQPAGAVELLRRIGDNPPLSAEHAQLLMHWMKDSPTGVHRIKAGLPPGTVVAHKTGSSGTHDGLTPATNDIGLIFLPDGRRLALAVFVTDSKADEATRDAVIAHIARAVYDAATTDIPPRP
jgi:beta-lactamase class A